VFDGVSNSIGQYTIEETFEGNERRRLATLNLNEIEESREKALEGEFIESDDAISVYITSIYFATTTMTTVGYGDISAKDNMYEQIYCMLMIFFGMALFALVQNRTMSLKNHETIKAEIETNTLKMERYLA
jgi:fructose-bisphosphate aldolase class 1